MLDAIGAAQNSEPSKHAARNPADKLTGQCLRGKSRYRAPSIAAMAFAFLRHRHGLAGGPLATEPRKPERFTTSTNQPR